MLTFYTSSKAEKISYLWKYAYNIRNSVMNHNERCQLLEDTAD